MAGMSTEVLRQFNEQGYYAPNSGPDDRRGRQPAQPLEDFETETTA